MTNFYRGRSFPLGATPMDGGVNFSVFSQSSTSVELLLFDDSQLLSPAQAITLDPLSNRTAAYWHVFVPGVGPGQIYAYRVHGPYQPQNGHLFDGQKVLLDPYGKCVAAAGYDRGAARRPGDNAAAALKSVVTTSRQYDWEGDSPLYRPFSQTVIYEMHVGGFMRHPKSGVAPEKRGTFAGVMEKIPHLLSLGITAVELLPVFHFDSQDAATGLCNYWGYSPISFFAPHAAYSSAREPSRCLDEFKDLVKALHRAGIEVILDVVFNHTAEGPEDGPTLCYRGFENSVYYILKKETGECADYSGCGNTLNTNHPIVRRMIRDSVTYWVSAMHVDGFRFDLASILSRDESGCLVPNAPILSDLESDPVLAGTKLIAEPWDLQAYQLGGFAGGNWKEWNGLFRDHVRRFVKGDACMVRNLAARVLGSPDLYEWHHSSAEQSVNFVACHDGFTLNDLVSYNHKHNEANGESNRDGSNDNSSWNCGCEGPSGDPAIERLRVQQLKNFLAITFLAVGTPMILMGDEARRTQRGNNNAYCQDNEIGWYDWDLLETNAELFHFVQHLIRFRLDFRTPHDDATRSLGEFLSESRIQWHGTEVGQPDWSDDSHSLAVMIGRPHSDHVIYIALNAWWNPLDFHLPAPRQGRVWSRIIDTSLPPPGDFVNRICAPLVKERLYTVQPRSTVVLLSEFQVRNQIGRK